MKPIQALVTCSLLGTLWLAACSSSSNKQAVPVGEAGAAGENSSAVGGEHNAAGAGGEGAVSEAGAAGEMSMGGEAGAGDVAPVCFMGLKDADPASKPKYSCATVRDQLSPRFDPANNTLVLDLSLLGDAVEGSYSYFYSYDNGDGQSVDCADNVAMPFPGQLVLPINPSHPPLKLELSAIDVKDACGNEASLTKEGTGGTCFNLLFSPDDSGTSFTVDCFEGTGADYCHPATCADYTAGL